MFIKELPEECLLIIFGSINELGDLLNCYEVCSKWRYLIAERTRKVKYFVEHCDSWNGKKFPSHLIDHVYYRSQEPIDATCFSTLFPNLKIADFRKFRKKVNHVELVGIVQKMKPLKGLNHYVNRYEESVFQYCDELEMVASDKIEPCILKNGCNIKQLYVWLYVLDDFVNYGHYFSNLERLHIDFCRGDHFERDHYKGPIFKRLKILELFLSSYYGFQFIDSCPNLQSAHIKLINPCFIVDESVKHKSLQDLVIDVELYIPPPRDFDGSIDWNTLKKMLMKYPNLKHFSLRGFKNLENKHMEQLVRILPNLVLFAVRECPGVTQEAANYIQDYNRRHGRSIKFYLDDNYHDIQSDWPHLSSRREKISQGFDFMRNSFLKDFDNLSVFLISNED